MPSPKNCFKIILISPSDLEREKKAIRKIIDETNNIFKDSDQLLLLYSWDTDVSASYNLEGPQGVVDKDLKIEDSDIVIVLFNKRFGTPTKNSKSGTEHEIKLALDSYNKRGSPIIKIYFKKPIVNLDNFNESDLAQFKILQEFRKTTLKDFFTKEFNTISDLETIIRRELMKFLIIKENGSSELLKESFKDTGNLEITRELINDDEVAEELTDDEEVETKFEKGVLDYTLEGEDSMNSIKDSLERMTESANNYVTNINSMNIDNFSSADTKTKMYLSIKFANEMDKFSKKIEMEQQIIKNSFESFYDSILGIIRLTEVRNDKEIENISTFKVTIENFNGEIDKLLEILKMFLEQIKMLIGISRTLNKSQYKLNKVTTVLIDNLLLGKLVCTKIVELIEEKFNL